MDKPDVRHRFFCVEYLNASVGPSWSAERALSEWIDKLPPEYVVPLDSPRIVELEGIRVLVAVAHHERARLDVHRAEVWGMANKKAILDQLANGVQVAKSV